MTEAGGQFFRRVGLVLEVASMLLMLATHRGNVSLWERTGLDPNIVLPVLFGVGVLVWMTGTLALRKKRKEKVGRWMDEEHK